MMVLFAVVCDQCAARSEEYGAWFICRECLDDVCESCIVAGSADEESGHALCKRCSQQGGAWGAPCFRPDPAGEARMVR